jgi:hypothetical protein
VLTNQVRYADPGRRELADVLDAARLLVPIDSRKPAALDSGEGWLKDSADMARIADRIADAAGQGRDGGRRLLTATRTAAEGCTLDPQDDLGIGRVHFPEPELVGAALRGADRVLRSRRTTAMLVRGHHRDRRRWARLDRELDTIARLGFAAFLAPLPVLALPGVGTATARTLGSYGLHTVGLLAATPLPTLQRILGVGPGRQLHQRAQGTDPTPVATGIPTRSFAAEHTFDRDELDPVEHRQVLLALTHHLGARLRTGDQAAGALTLTVRYADRSATTRSRSLAEPTAHTPALTATAYQLYEALALQRARVRALTLRAEGVRPAAHATRQLSLDPADDRAHRLEAVIDRSTTRYGTVVLTRAALCRIA